VEAIDDFSRAIELNPGDASLYSYRGDAYRKANDIEQSLADYTKAIDLAPTADRYVYRGTFT